MERRQLTLGLFADLYELTMAQAYWRSGVTEPATFSMFFRNYPPGRAYFVFAGLLDVVEFLQDYRFAAADIEFLVSLDQFDRNFLDYLSRIGFTGTVRAMQEGTIFFTDEPVIEVTAPVIEAQIIETFLINQINLQTILATKASRVVHVAPDKLLVDFAARRTHGTDAASKLARASYMVGFAGTSNVLAGGTYGIPTFGTMAHSFVTAFEDEADSFRAYWQAFPDSSTFLVDTYDTLDGTRNAIKVAQEMRCKGHSLRAIRLDSGDLVGLSQKARALLDQDGLKDVQVFASGGLDEFEVCDLLERGAPIDGFGVGTKVGVSADAPWTDCVYKLVEYGGRPVLKLSPEKQTLPGPKQVYRYRDGSGVYVGDVIATANEPAPHDRSEPLLRDVMVDGKAVGAHPTLGRLRERFRREFASLPDRHKRLRRPSRYEVGISDGLDQLRATIVEALHQRHES